MAAGTTSPWPHLSPEGRGARPRAQVFDSTSSKFALSCSILHAGNSGLFGAVGATEGLALCLDPVADDAAAAMGAPGRHAFDCTFETVECHAPLTLSDNDRLVVVVSAHITHWHMTDLSVRLAGGAAARLPARHWSDSGGRRPGRCRTTPLPSRGHSGTWPNRRGKRYPPGASCH